MPIILSIRTIVELQIKSEVTKMSAIVDIIKQIVEAIKKNNKISVIKLL
ncbi:hypothetical protein SEVCU012_0640 [Staphylococcus pettenkoferi VCU012]|nr:hypothetical protein SEVCU012_0640 [Staphylococcus pettenkoferi VCU012]